MNKVLYSDHKQEARSLFLFPNVNVLFEINVSYLFRQKKAVCQCVQTNQNLDNNRVWFSVQLVVILMVTNKNLSCFK